MYKKNAVGLFKNGIILWVCKYLFTKVLSAVSSINTLDVSKCLADFCMLIKNPAKNISLKGHADKEVTHSKVFSPS